MKKRAGTGQVARHVQMSKLYISLVIMEPSVFMVFIKMFYCQVWLKSTEVPCFMGPGQEMGQGKKTGMGRVKNVWKTDYEQWLSYLKIYILCCHIRHLSYISVIITNQRYFLCIFLTRKNGLPFGQLSLGLQSLPGTGRILLQQKGSFGPKLVWRIY